MKKVKKDFLVIGANGMLGYGVSEYFKRKRKTVIEIIRKEFDIAKDPIKKLEKYVKSARVVINCAGVIKPQIEKNKIEDVLKINGLFPWNLAKLCLKQKVECFHITTDCVFSGKKGKYAENDFVDADDLYGLSKASGDTPLCMTLRTSIIGKEKRKKRSLFEWVLSQKNKEVNGFMNHQWNGVTTVYLAEVIEMILNRKLYKSGVFHIYSPKTVSKYGLVKMINKVYKLKMIVNKISAPEIIDRTLRSNYDLSQKLVKKPIQQQIEEMKDFF